MSSDGRKHKLGSAEVTSPPALPAVDQIRKFSPKDSLDVILIVHYARLRAAAPDSKEHPIFRLLWEGYVLRLERYLETPREKRSREKLQELEEFRSWVIAKRPTWNADNETFAGNIFVERGATYEGAQKKIREVRSRGSGRPRSNAGIAIRGLELKTLDQSLQWRDITGRVCDCGKDEHGNCEERLHNAVGELRTFMRKYGLIQ